MGRDGIRKTLENSFSATAKIPSDDFRCCELLARPPLADTIPARNSTPLKNVF
jgi:hypothetical protein